MLKVFLHSAAPNGLSPFNQLGRLDIAYEKLDAYADYKVALTQVGLGEYPLAFVRDNPRWTASIWDLVMRAICTSLWLKETLPTVKPARRGAFTDQLTAVVEHWPDGFDMDRATVGRAELRMQRQRGHYLATFSDDILGDQQSTEFVHKPDGLSPWDLLARAYAWTSHGKFDVPARPKLYTKLTIEEGGHTLVPLDMVKEPARTGLERWLVKTGMTPTASTLVSGACLTEAQYLSFLRTAV